MAGDITASKRQRDRRTRSAGCRPFLHRTMDQHRRRGWPAAFI